MRSVSKQASTARSYAPLKQRTYAITKHGREMFNERLRQLAGLRKDMLEQIHALRDQQADEPLDMATKLAEMQHIDNEMYRLDAILARSQALDVQNRDTVSVGCRVKLRSGDNVTDVVLVSSVEADPSSGFISCESPIGKLLLGRHLNETVVLETPRTRHGVQHKTYSIVAIEHGAV